MQSDINLLHPKEDILTRLFHQVPALIAYIDTSSRFCYMNHAYADWYGVKASTSVGKNVQEVIGADVYSQLHTHLDQAFSGMPVYFESDTIQPGGIKTLGYECTPDLDESGRICGCILLAKDITRQREMERELERKNKELQDYFDNATVGLHWVNKDGIIVWANKAELNLLGYTKEEYIGHHIAEFHADQATINDILNRLANKESLTQYEAVMRCKDGSTRIVLINSNVLWDEGRFIHTRCFTLDITEKKMAETTMTRYYAELEQRVAERTAELVRKNEELRKSEERYHKMISEVQDYAILLMDPEGNIQDWNTGAEKIKGYKKEEIIGKNFRLFYTPDDQKNKRPERLIKEAIETGKANDENWRVRKDGTLFWASVTITALHDEENKIIGFSKVTRDLTQRRNAEEQLKEYAGQLQKKNEALDRANKELEQFTYAASHDMKEPLRKIALFNDLLLKNHGTHIPEKAKEFLNKSTDAAIRMQKLIDDLLAYSRTTVSSEIYEPVDLNKVLQEIKNNNKETLEEKGALLEWDTLPVVQAVAFQMTQLFDNLISNALKYQPDGQQPVIKISYTQVEDERQNVTTKDTYHKISVADNGIGFRTEYAEQIFDLFRRLNTRRSYSGTGIGLAICKKIVENHNGFIVAEGKENEGARFHVYLPTKTEHLVE